MSEPPGGWPRMITTRNFAGFNNGPGTPRSYLFSVTSNKPVPRAKLNPTLVLYFDADALDPQKDLVIHRYDERTSSWEVVETYLPAGAFYAAIPLTADNAPNLVDDGSAPAGPHVEHYRLFLVEPSGPPAS